MRDKNMSAALVLCYKLLVLSPNGCVSCYEHQRHLLPSVDFALRLPALWSALLYDRIKDISDKICNASFTHTHSNIG